MKLILHNAPYPFKGKAVDDFLWDFKVYIVVSSVSPRFIKIEWCRSISTALDYFNKDNLGPWKILDVFFGFGTENPCAARSFKGKLLEVVNPSGIGKPAPSVICLDHPGAYCALTASYGRLVNEFQVSHVKIGLIQIYGGYSYKPINANRCHCINCRLVDSCCYDCRLCPCITSSDVIRGVFAAGYVYRHEMYEESQHFSTRALHRKTMDDLKDMLLMYVGWTELPECIVIKVHQDFPLDLWKNEQLFMDHDRLVRERGEIAYFAGASYAGHRFTWEHPFHQQDFLLSQQVARSNIDVVPLDDESE